MTAVKCNTIQWISLKIEYNIIEYKIIGITHNSLTKHDILLLYLLVFFRSNDQLTLASKICILYLAIINVSWHTKEHFNPTVCCVLVLKFYVHVWEACLGIIVKQKLFQFVILVVHNILQQSSLWSPHELTCPSDWTYNRCRQYIWQQCGLYEFIAEREIY